MKRLITILIIPLFIFMLISTVSAHKGRTDAQGGHYNRTTGEYHYHHGYPEHQHFNGECPYQDEEKEKQEILEKKRENYYEKEEKKNSPFSKTIGAIFIGGMIGWLSSSFLCGILSLIFKKHEDLFMGKVLIILTVLSSILFFVILLNSM